MILNDVQNDCYKMIVLLFSCDFDVVMAGSEYHVYLRCHLDWVLLHCILYHWKLNMI